MSDDLISRKASSDAETEEVDIYKMIAHLEELGLHQEKQRMGETMSKHIDIDELKEWVENWLYKDRYYHNGRVSKNIPIPELYDILEQMPTADVPERNVGKWVGIKIGNGDTRYTCSECGASYECDSRDSWDFNFCPHCGAQMG